MKKLSVYLIFFLVFTLLLCACGNTASSEKSLYDQGLDIIALMDEAVRSDGYLDLFTSSDALRTTIQEITEGNYTAPSAVYSIRFPEDALFQFCGTSAPENLSESLLAYLNHRLLPAAVTQLNATGGVEKLSASSVCTISKAFVNSTLTEDILYLYTFETGFPISVVFTPGENGAVSATGTFLLLADFPCSSPEEIEAFFGEIPVEISQIHP